MHFVNLWTIYKVIVQRSGNAMVDESWDFFEETKLKREFDKKGNALHYPSIVNSMTIV